MSGGDRTLYNQSTDCLLFSWLDYKSKRRLSDFGGGIFIDLNIFNETLNLSYVRESLERYFFKLTLFFLFYIIFSLKLQLQKNKQEMLKNRVKTAEKIACKLDSIFWDHFPAFHFDNEMSQDWYVTLVKMYKKSVIGSST